MDIFLWEEERTVDKSGVFQLDGNKYPVSEHLVREKVQVRFDPFDLGKIRVYHNGAFVEVVSPEKTVSHTYTKAMPRRHDKNAPLESSKAFRRQLSDEYKARVQETMAAIPRESPDSEFLSERGFYEAALLPFCRIMSKAWNCWSPMEQSSSCCSDPRLPSAACS